MNSALHVKTRVQPGGKIEIETPGLIEGQSVDVFVILPQADVTPRRSALEIIEGYRTHHLPRDAGEIDRELGAERDSWDR